MNYSHLIKITLAFAALFLLSLMGCASPEAFVDPSWTTAPSKLQVIITKPVVDNVADFNDDLPEYKDDYSKWFQESFKEKFTTATEIPIELTEVADSTIVLERAVFANTAVMIPRSKNAIAGDIVLIISPIKVKRASESTTTYTSMNANGGMGVGGGMYPSSSTSVSLSYDGAYAYYDVKTGTRIGYGVFNPKAYFNFVLTTSDWEKNMESLVREVAKETPIKVKNQNRGRGR